MSNSFNSQASISVAGQRYTIYRLDALEKQGFNLARLPYSLRILLEMLLRTEDGRSVRAEDITAMAGWDARAEPAREIAFTPARVLLQDFTGVPCVVDLAAMREAMARFGEDPSRINPLQPVELVIDHSVQVDEFGFGGALELNVGMEFQRNRERYEFLKWGQNAFQNFRVVPPSTGIVHQVNLEYLARVVFSKDEDGQQVAYPDTLVGTDSHTTMINGIGVLGWGVGGIEAEAAMLGQPISMLIPQVVGFRLTNALPEGSTATDLVLTVTQMLREKGVVGKFVEFYGPGLDSLPLADRATISNMSPEYGATCGIFPVDDETLRYMRASGRSEEQIALVEAYMKEQGLFRTTLSPEAEYTDTLELDLNTVEPSIAGPKRPQDRISLSKAASAFYEALPALTGPPAPKEPLPGTESKPGPTAPATMAPQEVEVSMDGHQFKLGHGSVVIAAITSCTNTSNPSVMMAAGLLAKKAVERGLDTQPWVKTSLAPGSRVVTEYLQRAGLLEYLDKIRFNLVGYGCTTCIGNSGPLPKAISDAIEQGKLVACSVLSGNRNFEGRINQDVRANYLMSPPLVVAYALAGRIDIDFFNEPLGKGAGGQDVYLRDIWPDQAEVSALVEQFVQSDMFTGSYADVFKGDENWNSIEIPEGALFNWNPESTYVRNPPYFEGMSREEPEGVSDIEGARVLAVLGDSVTTDHISPAGAIKADSPAGQYLTGNGVSTAEYNSYGSRRGNHEVMVRGTFANIRIRNQLVPGVEGGYTRYLPTGEQMSIYDAAVRYQQDGTALVVIAGKEYGSGSSRDWAAKGPYLQGVKAVLAESFERIHRSNLIGMGIVPLQFMQGQNAASLGLTGEEVFSIHGVAEGLRTEFAGGRVVEVTARDSSGAEKRFQALVRLDTPKEMDYYRNGGILQYVLRQLLKQTRR